MALLNRRAHQPKLVILVSCLSCCLFRIRRTKKVGVYDTATHLAEEVVHPERAIPIAVMGTVLIGFFT